MIYICLQSFNFRILARSSIGDPRWKVHSWRSSLSRKRVASDRQALSDGRTSLIRKPIYAYTQNRSKFFFSLDSKLELA